MFDSRSARLYTSAYNINSYLLAGRFPGRTGALPLHLTKIPLIHSTQLSGAECSPHRSHIYHTDRAGSKGVSFKTTYSAHFGWLVGVGARWGLSERDESEVADIWF